MDGPVSREDIGKLVLRLGIGGMLLVHGIHKVRNGIDPIAEMVSGQGLPQVLAYGVYVGEVLAPIALLLGFLTRLAGAVVAINMLTALYLAHRHELLAVGPMGGWAIELPMLFCVGGIALALLGGGRLALSGRR